MGLEFPHSDFDSFLFILGLFSAFSHLVHFRALGGSVVSGIPTRNNGCLFSFIHTPHRDVPYSLGKNCILKSLTMTGYA